MDKMSRPCLLRQRENEKKIILLEDQRQKLHIGLNNFLDVTPKAQAKRQKKKKNSPKNPTTTKSYKMNFIKTKQRSKTFERATKKEGRNTCK